MATVKEAVKESLVGTTIEPQLSQQARASFLKHARQDEDGESYMTEEDFINAIAPENEDYVRFQLLSVRRFTTKLERLANLSVISTK